MTDAYHDIYIEVKKWKTPLKPVDWIGLSMYPNSEFNSGNIALKPAQIDAKFVEDARRVFNDQRQITISETGWQVCSANGCFENDQLAHVQWLVSEGRRLAMPFLINFFETDPVFTGPTGTVTLTMGFRTAAPELRHRPALGVFDALLP